MTQVRDLATSVPEALHFELEHRCGGRGPRAVVTTESNRGKAELAALTL
jgi:hypothetical protein